MEPLNNKKMKTGIDFIKTKVEEDSDTSFLNIDWNKFDEIINQAKEIDKELELKNWIEHWSVGYNSGWDNCIKKFKQNKMENGKQPITPLIQNGCYSFEGLTKREYFAGLAMQGILASNTEGLAHGYIDMSGLIPSAITASDALLYELEKTKQQE